MHTTSRSSHPLPVVCCACLQVSAAVVYWVILYVVHRSSSPGYRAILLQPLFVAITVAVAAGFIVIKG